MLSTKEIQKAISEACFELYLETLPIPKYLKEIKKINNKTKNE